MPPPPPPPPATDSPSSLPRSGAAQNRTSAPSESPPSTTPTTQPPPGPSPARPQPPPAPSGKKRRRRLKEKSERLNRKNWADGVRKDLILLKYVPLYVDALATSWEAAQEVIRQACAEYHAKIPYWLDDNDEPDLPLPDYDPNNPPVLPRLSDEEESLRSQILTIRNQAIHRWIHWRAKKLPGYRHRQRVNLDNPYDRMMVELTGLSAKGPKKALQPIQQYAVEHPDLVAAATQAWEDAKASGGGSVFFNDRYLDKRPVNWIMKELKKTWDPLSADEKKAYGERARAIAKAEREKWDKAFKDPPPRNAESIQKAWDYLQAFLTPTLHGLATHMDATVLVLVGARNPSENGNPTAKHFLIGKNLQGLPFSLFDQARFDKDVVGMFCDYIETMWTPEQCEAVALREDAMEVEESGPLGRTRFAQNEVSDEEDSDDDEFSGDEGESSLPKRPRPTRRGQNSAQASTSDAQNSAASSSVAPSPDAFDLDRPHQTFSESNAPPTEKGHARYAWELESFTRSIRVMSLQGGAQKRKYEQLLQEWKAQHYVDELSGVFYELVAAPGSSSPAGTSGSQSAAGSAGPSEPQAFDSARAQETFTGDNPPPVESGAARFAWELEKYDRSVVRLSWKGGADKRVYEQLMQAWHATHYVDPTTGMYVERDGPLDAPRSMSVSPSAELAPPASRTSSLPPLASPPPATHSSSPPLASHEPAPPPSVSPPPASRPSGSLLPPSRLSAAPTPASQPSAPPAPASTSPQPATLPARPAQSLPPSELQGPHSAQQPSHAATPPQAQRAAPPAQDGAPPDAGPSSSTPSLATPASALDNRQAAWFVEAWRYVAHELGPSWAVLLSRFARWEEANGFANSRKSLPTLNTRPKELQTWIGNARWNRQSGEPEHKDRASARRLLGGWWAWYKRLVPGWRQVNEDGSLKPLEEDGSQFDMGKLECCGLNGIYNLVVLLKWVKEGIDNPVVGDSIIHPELDREWEVAVRDLSGMLDRMYVVKQARLA